MKHANLTEVFVQECPRCQGKGYIRGGLCKNNGRCKFTDERGMIPYCLTCHRDNPNWKKVKGK